MTNIFNLLGKILEMEWNARNLNKTCKLVKMSIKFSKFRCSSSKMDKYIKKY
jgi:hypothetical protein